MAVLGRMGPRHQEEERRRKKQEGKRSTRLKYQLEISMISQKKHMNTLCVLYFDVVFLKNQNISSTFLQKPNTSSCYSACEKHEFFRYSSLM